MRPHHPALLLVLTFAIHAQVGTVQNAATYQTQTAAFANRLGYTSFISTSIAATAIGPNTIAPRMLAVLSYPSAQLVNDPFSIPPQPSVTATLSIRPVGSTSVIPVTVTSAIQGTVTFVVPAGVPVGGAELLYKIDDQATQWASVNIVPSSFAFFRASSSGPAIAQTIASNGSVANVGLATPAQPGQTLLLTGSGLGSGSTASATIGGKDAPVTSAGPHPTEAGHDRILIQIPAGAPDGCYVPITFTYNQITLTTTISKTSDGAPCKHPWRLSLSDMLTLDGGGSLYDGLISMATQLNAATSSTASRNESAELNLGSINASGIAAYFVLPPASPGCAALIPAPPAIAVFRSGDFSGLIPPFTDIGATVALQSSGGALTLPGTGTNYFSWTSPSPVDASLSSPPAPAIGGGKWTWQSSGGKDLPASSFDFTLPAPVQLNGGAPLLLKRGQDQTITWNGGVFDPAATVNLFLSAGTAAPVACSAPASAGTVTIPAALLPANATASIGSLIVTLAQPGALFPHATLKLQNGATLLMLVSYSTSDLRPVVLQ